MTTNTHDCATVDSAFQYGYGTGYNDGVEDAHEDQDVRLAVLHQAVTTGTRNAHGYPIIVTAAEAFLAFVNGGVGVKTEDEPAVDVEAAATEAYASGHHDALAALNHVHGPDDPTEDDACSGLLVGFSRSAAQYLVTLLQYATDYQVGEHADNAQWLIEHLNDVLGT